MSVAVTSGVARPSLRSFLDRKVEEYDRPSFIPDDPVSIPHLFQKRQDIEIAGFFAAVFSWGNRTTIIRKSRELMQLMDDAPHQFVLQHTDRDLKKLLAFRHRTFNATDLLYFVEFFHNHYSRFSTLEEAFLLAAPSRSASRTRAFSGVTAKGEPAAWDAGAALSAFHHYFFSLEVVPPRTRKHIASPDRNSSCKRLNMFLRWMVRKDPHGVDFGCWDRIPVSGLICPLDLHVARVARRFGLLSRPRADWAAALELTDRLTRFDPADPVKYDFALFALGALEKF